MQQFWTWAKLYGIDVDMDAYLDANKCIKFEKYLLFEFGKIMWKKHWSVFQDHVKYIHNDNVKHFRVVIIQYANCVRDMHNLSNYLTPYSMKGESFKSDSWAILEK